jgi:hypothetical protein
MEGADEQPVAEKDRIVQPQQKYAALHLIWDGKIPMGAPSLRVFFAQEPALSEAEGWDSTVASAKVFAFDFAFVFAFDFGWRSFTAAINVLFSVAALAAEVTVLRGRISPQPSTTRRRFKFGQQIPSRSLL